MKGDHQVILAVILFFAGIAFAKLVSGSPFNNFYPHFFTLISTFLGAYFAFKFKSSEDKRYIREKIRVAGNLAVFNITRILDILLRYQKQFILPVRGNEYAFLELRPIQTIEHINIDLDSLVFLLDCDDVNYLGELASAIAAANRIIDSINIYSQDHMNKLQPAIELSGILEKNKDFYPPLLELERAIGTRLYITMKGSAHDIIQNVDSHIPIMQSVIVKLGEILLQIYPNPNERVIKYKAANTVSIHMPEFEKLLKKLDDLTSSANTSCSEFTNILIALGFEIENCGSAGHKIARHPAVSLIEYPNYNCGHNRGEAVKRPYIKKLYKFVKQHEEAIKEYLK